MLFNIWVTSSCNFRCKYCYVPQYESNMDEKVGKFLIEFIQKKVPDEEKEIIINFHGGEPLLNFNLIKKIIIDLEEKMANRTVLFGITTNGSLLTKDISDFLAKKFHYNLSISLDGNKKINDQNRVYINNVGTYNLVINNFIYLKNIFPDVRVRMTYNHETVSDTFAGIQHIINLGFSKIVAIPDFSDTQWNDEYIKRMKYQIEQIFSNYYNNKNVDINIISDDIRREHQSCHGGISSFNVYIDGNIYPCTWTVGNRDFIIGNIYDGVNERKVRNLLTHSLEPMERCEGCGLYNACIGNRCRMINKIITKDYCKVPLIRCEYNNIIYEIQKKYREERLVDND